MSRSLLAFVNCTEPYPTPSVWRAAINSVTDGDTLWVERDTGCREDQLIEIRVTGAAWKGFNAAERFTVDGKAITAKVKQFLTPGFVVRIETKPDTEKYGRWLSPILIQLALVTDVLGPDDVLDGCLITIDNRVYLDLAAYLVANVKGAVWQTY